MLASLIFGLTSIANAEEAQQLTCTGMMIEPTRCPNRPKPWC